MTTTLTVEPGVLDRAWSLHPQVAVRPESFGALLYHYGTRRLSFLKDPLLATVVRGLDAADSARLACLASGVPEARLPQFSRALEALAATDMIRGRQ